MHTKRMQANNPFKSKQKTPQKTDTDIILKNFSERALLGATDGQRLTTLFELLTVFQVVDFRVEIGGLQKN